MLVPQLRPIEREMGLAKLKVQIQKEYDNFREEALKKTPEELFNMMEEIIFKIHLADEILSEDLRNLDGAMYVTEGDYDQILINLNDIIKTEHNLLQYICDAYNPAMQDPIVDHDAIISHLYENFADDKQF